MSTSQDIKDTADSVAFAKAQLAIQQPLFDAKNDEVEALVTSEAAALVAAQSAYNDALAAARVTAGWQPVADAYNDAVLTVENGIVALQAVIAEYDGL